MYKSGAQVLTLSQYKLSRRYTTESKENLFESLLKLILYIENAQQFKGMYFVILDSSRHSLMKSFQIL